MIGLVVIFLPILVSIFLAISLRWPARQFGETKPTFGPLKMLLATLAGLFFFGFLMSNFLNPKETLTGQPAEFADHLRYGFWQAVIMSLLVVPANLFAFQEGKQRIAKEGESRC